MKPQSPLTKVLADENKGYELLGITRAQADAAPQIGIDLAWITDSLRDVIKERGGEFAEAIANLKVQWHKLLAASEFPDARKVLEKYASIPDFYAKNMPIEAFCVAADVSPLRIIEILTGIIVRRGVQAATVTSVATSLHVSNNMLGIVDVGIQMAKTDKGWRDREMIYKHAGFLPIPSSAQTSIHIQQNANATATPVFVAPPSIDNTVRQLHQRFNEAANLLPAPTEPPPDITISDDEDVEE